ncbi:MAG: hypothetical protein AAF236_07895, partial [Verrucomicrobiota bacterium]
RNQSHIRLRAFPASLMADDAEDVELEAPTVHRGMVAIPAYVFYAHLRAYAKSLMHDMESAGIEIVNTICDLRLQPGDIIAMRSDVQSESEPGMVSGRD